MVEGPCAGGPEGDRRGRHGRGVLVANRHAAGSSAWPRIVKVRNGLPRDRIARVLFCVEQGRTSVRTLTEHGLKREGRAG